MTEIDTFVSKTEPFGPQKRYLSLGKDEKAPISLVCLGSRPHILCLRLVLVAYHLLEKHSSMCILPPEKMERLMSYVVSLFIGKWRWTKIRWENCKSLNTLGRMENGWLTFVPRVQGDFLMNRFDSSLHQIQATLVWNVILNISYIWCC